MARYLAIVGALLVPACGFTAPADPSASGDPTMPPDMTTPPPTARYCDTADPALRLCIDFEDTGSLMGDAGPGHHDATYSGIAVMDRENDQGVMEHAIELSATSRVTVPETPDLDIASNLTVTLFAHPDSRPQSGASYWALDNNTQYYVSYQSNGKFRCGIGNTTVDSALALDAGSWYQVACTFDPQHGLRIYVDGYLAGCRTATSIPTGGHDGTAIGANHGAGAMFTDPFIGGLDNIQVFARAFTAGQVCDAAGGGYCNDICPFID